MIARGIGLLGGTFDPVHLGHIEVARAAAKAFNLVRTDLLPAGSPWQKDLVTPAEHRLAMIELALDKMLDLGIERMELMRSGPTYTIETLAQLRRRVGTGMPLVLILGGDQWRNLHTWRSWRELTNFASLGVCARSGEPLTAAEEVVLWSEGKLCPAESLTETPCGRVSFFSMQPHEASATVVRRTLAKRPFASAMQALDGWLPSSVAGYILSHRLYGAHS